MSTPNVTITKIDGAIGIVPPGSGDIMAIVGPCTSGPIGIPAMYASTAAAVATFGGGPTMEAAAYAFDAQAPSKPVVIVRSEASPGTYGTLAKTMTGTSVPSTSVTAHPLDDYELVVVFIAGGTVGVDGITYQWSLDGGRTMSPTTSLGTADSVVIPDSGVAVDLDVGTIVAGDTFSVLCKAPTSTPTQLAAALAALGGTSLEWGFAQVVGPIDGAAASTITAFLAAREAAGRPTLVVGNCALPTAAQTEAEYLAAQTLIFKDIANTGLAVCFGAARIDSYLTRRQYRRPISFAVAARISKLEIEVDAAEVEKGALPGVVIRDANGNVVEHDEVASPGADDARFVALRTIDGYAGVYINNPRILCQAGSDYVWIQYTRIINRACRALRSYFTAKLSKGIFLNKKTGYIRESDAVALDNGGLAILRDTIGGRVSGYSVVLSRVDNVLSTSKITVKARIIPKGYPKGFGIEIGFENPARVAG